MEDYLFKKDALITLYPKYDDKDDFYPITINKNGFGTYYEAWFEFQPELDELSIRFHMDDWICEDESLDREQLSEELRKRGFNVKLI